MLHAQLQRNFTTTTIDSIATNSHKGDADTLIHDLTMIFRAARILREAARASTRTFYPTKHLRFQTVQDLRLNVKS
jgi:hypothetical protein